MVHILYMACNVLLVRIFNNALLQTRSKYSDGLYSFIVIINSLRFWI